MGEGMRLWLLEWAVGRHRGGWACCADYEGCNDVHVCGCLRGRDVDTVMGVLL